MVGNCCAFSQTPSTTVTSITVNDTDLYDIEVYMDNKSNIYIPVKQTAKIFNIPVSVNHSQKELTFSNYEGKNILVNKNGVFYKDGNPDFKKTALLKLMNFIFLLIQLQLFLIPFLI